MSGTHTPSRHVWAWAHDPTEHMYYRTHKIKGEAGGHHRRLHCTASASANSPAGTPRETAIQSNLLAGTNSNYLGPPRCTEPFFGPPSNHAILTHLPPWFQRSSRDLTLSHGGPCCHPGSLNQQIKPPVTLQALYTGQQRCREEHAHERRESA